MEKECPYYQGVCGLDEQYVCFCRSYPGTCEIYSEHTKKLIEEVREQNE